MGFSFVGIWVLAILSLCRWGRRRGGIRLRFYIPAMAACFCGLYEAGQKGRVAV